MAPVDVALWSHQREVAAVAQHRSALLSSPQPVGKTFLSAALLREAAERNDSRLTLAVAASLSERTALQLELARLCGFRVLNSDAGVADTSSGESSATRWLEDVHWVQHQLSQRDQVVLLSPSILQELVRKSVISLRNVGLLVVENFDQVHAELPALFRLVAKQLDDIENHGGGGSACLPRIFATSRLLASQMDWNPASNPLLSHIQVLNMVPVLSSASMTSSFPPLLCETFAESQENGKTGTEPENQEVSVRDFLLGENCKKVDLVRVFRLELELGNSKATYDDRKKQDKVNRFIQDAEAVEAHLGRWCLWKFVELELQANLQACIVQDPDNANIRRKRHQQEINGDEEEVMDDPMGSDSDEDEDEEGEAADGETTGDEDDVISAKDELSTEDSHATEDGTVSAKTDLLIAKIIGPSVELDDTTKQKLTPILRVIAWLATQARKCGTLAATTRLLKTAEVVRNRFVNAPGETDLRAWVFLERRCHCRVVAEYLTLVLADVPLPPAACMLGSSNARVSGSLRFSSFRKVMLMFTSYKVKVMVTTSVANKSQKLRIDPPSCDLVVVMDELLEPQKLFDFGKRAHPSTGVVKYITTDDMAAQKKFGALVRKMQEFVHVEEEQNGGMAFLAPPAGATDPGVDTRFQFSLSATGALSEGSTTMTASTTGSTLTALQTENRIGIAPRKVQPVGDVFEIKCNDTGAVLNVKNSVECLSKFCDTLPGLDTYDRRPQYVIRRISVQKRIAPSIKRTKKKLLKYNSNLNDKIDDLKAAAEAQHKAEAANAMEVDEEGKNEDEDSATPKDTRFHYSATLRLPNALGIKKQLISSKVETDAEAKGIVAFKACQELIKKGLLDRHFRSKLLDDQIATIHPDAPESGDSSEKLEESDKTPADDTIMVDDDGVDGEKQGRKQQLGDLSTQSSYDLPPVSAAELSLRPIRSLTREAEKGSEEGEEWSTTMCFYGLTGSRFAILATDELYTGNTNTGWRYNFATSGVMTPDIHPVTLAKHALKLKLTKQQLQDALHFHLVIMRMACMSVREAVRDVDVSSDNIWNEFSEQNDKGYLVVPSVLDETIEPAALSLDWDYVREIIGTPLLEPLWPLPPELTTEDASAAHEEWICVPTYRTNASYVVQGFSSQKVANLREKYLASDEAWARHLKKGKSTPGNPILGRWHTREQLADADEDQPLIHGTQIPPIVPIIRRVMQRNLDEDSVALYKTKFNERLLIPQFTSRLRLSKSRYFEAMGFVPLLYEFERKCQISHLMGEIGLELDMDLLDDATTKPAYERLEILGDTFLKLETSWYMYEKRKDIVQEGALTQLRRDIIRNDRLNQFALAARLQHYMLYPAEVEQHPFKCWKPSCMGKTPEPVVAPCKWIADVLEAICGAYLVGQGEKGARYFLRWVGVSVLEDPSSTFARPFYPDCFPSELYDDTLTSNAPGSLPLSLNFQVPQFEDLPKRLMMLQRRLKYTFRNKRLLLEAVTHPSVGKLVLHIDQMDTTDGAGNGGDISVASHSNKQKKMMWKGDYERLEYLGDALIEYLTLSYAFLKYDTWLPGSLSQWKSATVSNDALGKTALACFGVDECIFAGAVRIDRETMERVGRIERKYAADTDALGPAFAATVPKTRRNKSRSQGQASHTLPKMFADVFEALVAAVFLDSGRDLQLIRDVFMGPLVDTVGEDAFAYVCHESGLTVETLGDELMEDLLFSSDEDE